MTSITKSVVLAPRHLHVTVASTTTWVVVARFWFGPDQLMVLIDGGVVRAPLYSSRNHRRRRRHYRCR